MSVHPLAYVSPTAKVAEGVEIGPFCVVEDDVRIGPGCILESRVAIKRGTILGENNHLFDGSVVGGLPQHTHLSAAVGDVVIGAGNSIRENVTIHRAMQSGSATVIGDNCLFMCNSHIAHDCRVEDHVILTNNVMLAGHVTVGARAYLGGGAGVHQFCRVGTLAMIGGLAHISRDVPPFLTIDGQSGFAVGLNKVGLRRAGFDGGAIVRLKEAYRVIYRSGLSWNEILERLSNEFQDAPAAEFQSFLAATKRGITQERRMPPGATLRIHAEEEPEGEIRRRKVG